MTCTVQKLNGVNSTEWMDQPGNKYVGRYVRIPGGKNAGHHWPNSGFGNPYKFENDSESGKRVKLLEYCRHLKRKLNSCKIVSTEFMRLVGLAAKGQLVLGCWCMDWDGRGKVPLCHAAYLARIIEHLEFKGRTACKISSSGEFSLVYADDAYVPEDTATSVMIRRAW